MTSYKGDKGAGKGRRLGGEDDHGSLADEEFGGVKVPT